MTRHDGATFASLTGQPRNGDEPVFAEPVFAEPVFAEPVFAEPVFAEPWQAEAFALTVRLHEADCFTWTEWAGTLAAVLREVRERGEPDDGSHYYDHWLVALERLVTAKQVLSASDLEQRKAAWAEAYLATPHGQPVMLPPGAA